MIGLAAGDPNGSQIRMSVRLAESLFDGGGFDPEDVLDRYLTWWREGVFETGPVSARALEPLAVGMPAPDATAHVQPEFSG